MEQLQIPEDYEPLFSVLMLAFKQAAYGKGKERHANDKPFTEQPILQIQRMLGDDGFAGHAFQIMKKVQEANTMVSRGKYGEAQRELLGAIVYAAAAHCFIEEIIWRGTATVTETKAE